MLTWAVRADAPRAARAAGVGAGQPRVRPDAPRRHLAAREPRGARGRAAAARRPAARRPAACGLALKIGPRHFFMLHFLRIENIPPPCTRMQR